MFFFFFKALYLTFKSHFCRQNLSLLVERYITTVENENRTLDHLAKRSTLDRGKLLVSKETVLSLLRQATGTLNRVILHEGEAKMNYHA